MRVCGLPDAGETIALPASTRGRTHEPMSEKQLIFSVVLVTACMYAIAAARAFIAWRRDGAVSMRWLAASMLSYAAAHVIFSWGDWRTTEVNEAWYWTVAFLGLTVAPWCVLRFAAELCGVRTWVLRVADVLTVITLASQVVEPGRISVGYIEPTPAQAVVHASLAIQTLFAITAASVLLWRASVRQPGFVRSRYLMLAAAIPILYVAQSLSGIRDFPAVLVITALLWGAILLLVCAALPPRVLRNAWQAPQLRQILRELADVSALTEETTIRTQLLPRISEVACAQRTVLRDVYTGEELAVWGRAAEEVVGAPVQRVRVPASSVELVLFGTPHDPFFARDDLELARDLATHLDVALGRSRIIGLERAAAGALTNANVALQNANRDLRELADLRDNFVAIASHELRTPITTIMGFTSTMLDLWDTLDEERRRTYLEMVDRDARRLGQLVEDLLLLSSVESPDFRVERERVEVRSGLEHVLEDVGVSTELVTIEVEDDLAVDADPRHLRQIFGNLLSNAIKYGAPPLLLHAWKEGDAVRIEMRDAGPGIPGELREQVFERFARAPGSTVGGTGLGLFIVRRLAEIQGGRAWYEDAQPHGARFVVELAAA
jgi:signal transduction histidine kinase